MSQMRVLPLMIFVAILAFTVRLADVVIGVRSMTGAAQAPESKPAEHGKEEPAKEEKKKGKGEEVPIEEIPLPPPIEGPMDSDKQGALQFPEGTPPEGAGEHAKEAAVKSAENK